MLVTGATGFKGAWLSFWLKCLGSKVYGVSLPPSKEDIFFKETNLKNEINQSYFNINNFQRINSYIRQIKPDIIFHLAAQSLVSEGYTKPLETFSSNIIGSANILESTRKNKIKSLIYVTSDKCYLNLGLKKNFKEQDTLGGEDNYSASKASAELIFHSYYNSYFRSNSNLQIASVRAGNVIGGGDFKRNRIIPDLVRSIINRKSIYLRNPKSNRPWQHVLEPISGYLQLGLMLLDNKIKNKVYPSWNFGPIGQGVQVEKLSKNFFKIWGIKKKIIFLKKEKFKESLNLGVNISKARQELGWTPKLKLDETLNLTVDWYKNFILKKDSSLKTLEQIDFFSSKKLNYK